MDNDDVEVNTQCRWPFHSLTLHLPCGDLLQQSVTPVQVVCMLIHNGEIMTTLLPLCLARTGQPLPCRHGTIAQLMASLTRSPWDYCAIDGIIDACARRSHGPHDGLHQIVLPARAQDAQALMTRYANQDRMEPHLFVFGDGVYVHTDHIRTNRTARKLARKKISPFPIVTQPSAMSLTPRFPSTICIHPVLHVAQLEPEDPNTFEDCDQTPLQLIVDGNPEYLIERIIDSKYNRVRCKYHSLYHLATRAQTTHPIGSLRTPSTTKLENSSRALIMSSIPQNPGPEHLAKEWEQSQVP